MIVKRKYRGVVEVIEVTYDNVTQAAFVAADIRAHLPNIGEVRLGEGDDPMTAVWECETHDANHELAKFIRDVAVQRNIPTTFVVEAVYLMPVEAK